MSTLEMKAAIAKRARELGFDAVGFARADVPLTTEFERYQEFVARGWQGEMSYLAENQEARRRLDGPEILEGAKTVVCVAENYRRADESGDCETARTIARYARGSDYHNFVRRRLRRLAKFVRRLASAERPVSARPCTDAVPILERVWASRAGLGFIGKNGLIIVPGVGSMVLLGEVITSLELPADEPIAERCGECVRCLDACPTQAFERPFVLNPQRCISYWTIEQTGPIPDAIKETMNGRLFGCDDCQTVCPFNQSKKSPSRSAETRFEPAAAWRKLGLESLATMSDPAWTALAEGSPVRRATREGLQRNAWIQLGHRSALDASVDAARSAPHPAVQDAAGWAIRRLVKRAE